MFVALSDRFLFFNNVRQVILHAPAPRCEVSVIFVDSTSKRFHGADAERIIDFLSTHKQPFSGGIRHDAVSSGRGEKV